MDISEKEKKVKIFLKKLNNSDKVVLVTSGGILIQ
jgi:hypothetical protein